MLYEGYRSGYRDGHRVGLNPGADPLAGVTRDAASGVYVPASATEWAAVLSVAGDTSGGPSLIYGCQDPSGDLAEAGAGISLLAAGTGMAYQQAVTGWTRKALTTTQGSTGRWASIDASLPDPTLENWLCLVYAKFSAPSALRSLIEYGSTQPARLEVVTATTRFQYTHPINAATGTVDPSGSVQPFWMGHNIDDSANIGISLAEKLVPTYTNTPSGKRLVLGSIAMTNLAASYLYFVFFRGAAARKSAATIKAIDTTLGWTPTFT